MKNIESIKISTYYNKYIRYMINELILVLYIIIKYLYMCWLQDLFDTRVLILELIFLSNYSNGSQNSYMRIFTLFVAGILTGAQRAWIK